MIGKNISIKDFETETLIINKQTIDEQFVLCNILRYEKVNRCYFTTPDRIFIKNYDKIYNNDLNFIES